MVTKLERRWTPGEIEVRDRGGKVVIEGHGAVFNRLSHDLGGFVERVLPGTFTKTIQEADVRALYNHDKNMVLGRNKSGTLELSQDESGLYYRIFPPDTTYARDLQVVIERGDVTSSSFAFYTVHDDWGQTEAGYPQRSLSEVKLVDVSPVTYPAYPDADSGIASIDRAAALNGLAIRSGVEITDLSDAESIRKALAGETEESESSESHSENLTRWQRRARFMADLERMVKEQ